MSIASFISEKLNQTIVYWGSPVNDGYGGHTFATPVEIDGRWEGIQEIVVNDEGQEVVSQARVWVSQDVDVGGYLFLGSLDDSGYDSDPLVADGAMRIIAFSKKPALINTTAFERKAYLRIIVD